MRNQFAVRTRYRYRRRSDGIDGTPGGSQIEKCLGGSAANGAANRASAQDVGFASGPSFDLNRCPELVLLQAAELELQSPPGHIQLTGGPRHIAVVLA